MATRAPRRARGARRRAGSARREVRDGPDMWGPPARERERRERARAVLGLLGRKQVQNIINKIRFIPFINICYNVIKYNKKLEKIRKIKNKIRYIIMSFTCNFIHNYYCINNCYYFCKYML